ncbi:transcriptional regulator Myc-1-like isoform X2 [Genypterus blacodes]|uniref:transcriptional regulator Myc-1-like isoform X2 n=1 Tax=Genypterus blacodes TaxID=154954 RepID=UPI003F76EE77
MPPVLTMASGNYDYDYDSVQPYFLSDDQDQDFYPPPLSQLQPGPGEDIWKKFELLQTPPLSPSRRSSLCNVPSYDSDHLEAVAALLDSDCDPSSAYLQSFIIQDCMWSSSFAAAAKLERVVTERLASLRARLDSSAADRQTDGQVHVNPVYLQDLHAATSDCIDPSVVFPCSSVKKQSVGGPAAELHVDSAGLSGSSDSDSESDEEEEEDDDEEEIDVVTVEKQRRASRRSEASSRPDTRSLVLKRCHISTHQHNYAAQQPSPTPDQPTVKRSKSEAASKCWSPPRSPADAEDANGEDKRRTHNVLERQRRNELKLSFLSLRDEVPAVAKNNKAAKVVILKKATECIVGMQAEEQTLVAMKDELRKRSGELKQRLGQLRRNQQDSRSRV